MGFEGVAPFYLRMCMGLCEVDAFFVFDEYNDVHFLRDGGNDLIIVQGTWSLL